MARRRKGFLTVVQMVFVHPARWEDPRQDDIIGVLPGHWCLPAMQQAKEELRRKISGEGGIAVYNSPRDSGGVMQCASGALREALWSWITE